MNCSPFDLRDYLLDELDHAARAAVETHARASASCREELDPLRLTQAALLHLREEEMPQRIAFVSDKIFEPTRWRRWAAAFWNSSARLAFASAMLLFGAALVWHRPAPPAPPPAVDLAQYETRLRAEIAAAVASSEARQQQKTAELLAAAEKRYETDRRYLMLTVAENFEVLRKRLGTTYVAGNRGAAE
jgi:hypothetical protein